MKYLSLLLAGLFLHAMVRAQGCTTNYVAPSFQLQQTNPDCNGNTGRIEVINQSGGVAPFTYKAVEINATNSTGVFPNLSSGLYTIEMRDACGTVRTRQVTLVPWSFSFTYTVNKVDDCSNGQVEITATPATGNFQYGVVKQGDTTWSVSPSINIKLYKTLTILVKDACGNVQSKEWVATPSLLPYIKELQHRLQCDKFDIFPVYFGFVDPHVCLYEFGTNRLVACKDAPGQYNGGYLTNFFDIPWGSYYVIVSDNCYRDSAFHPDMRSAGGSELNPYNWDCNFFTLHVDGLEDTVCLYNAVTNQLIGCKGQDTVTINPRTGVRWPSGAVWDSLPYGSYYAWIYDPCMDSTFKIDTTVIYPFRTYSYAYPGCYMNQTTVHTSFYGEAKKPYTVKVYNSNWTLNSTLVTNDNEIYVPVTPDGTGNPMPIITLDACGHADTSSFVPSVTSLARSINIYNKCPGLFGNSGSGDVTIFASTYSSVVPTPRVVKVNGTDTTINASFHVNDNFEFANLPSATYIFEYSFSNCAQLTVRDTVTINDYVYPGQTLDTAIQCGGNQFTFTYPVTGGLSPYTFQIIGNTPALPSLTGAVQPSPTFVVGNGQHYTSVKVRAIDRCGNSTIGDVAIQPINGCSTLALDVQPSAAGVSNALATVHPNPASGQFTVSISRKKKTDYRIEIVNTAGVRLFGKQFYAVDKKDVVVNEPLPPGLYIVNVVDLKSGDVSTFKEVIR